MLQGTLPTGDRLQAIPKEMLALIILQLPYALQLKLRVIAKYWKDCIEKHSPLPLLNNAVVQSALSYTSSKQANYQEIDIEALYENYATLQLSPTLLDSLVMKFQSKNGYVTEEGVFEYYPAAPEITISVDKVFLFALKKGYLTEQYDSLVSRDERHHFITHYMALPNHPNCPRWKFLNKQSKASLQRLQESLGRYQDPAYRALSQEVYSALLAIEAGLEAHSPILRSKKFLD